MQGFSTAGAERSGFDPTRLERMHDYMAGMISRGQVAGATTLILRHGKIADFRTQGLADLQAGTPLSADSVFRIYSMTKPVVSAAMMMLFEEGRWALDDPVTRFAPEFAGLKVCTGLDSDGRMTTVDAVRPPTMRELLSHTAGFGYGLFDHHPVERAFTETEVLHAEGHQQFIDRVASIPLLFQPGTEWFYSVATDLLGAILTRISGEPLGDFLTRRVFDPLGMVDTGFHASGNADRLVRFYRDDGAGGLAETIHAFGKPIRDFARPPRREAGGGGLVSTALDFGRFCQMILNKGELDGARLLSPVAVELMATNVIPDAVLAVSNPLRLLPFNPAFGMGLGFSVMKDPRRMGSVEGPGTLAWGGMGGTWFWIDPANDLAFVGLIQRLADPVSGEFRAKARLFTYAALTRPEL